MLILGIDTATLTLSAALVERSSSGDRVLTRVTEPPPTPHSTLLPQLVETMLGNAGAKLKDLAAVVVGLGPGSFTGLRISLATAKGLCYAAQIPLVGASSLAAMAMAATRDIAEKELLVPCLDARKGEVYAGFYRCHHKVLEQVSKEEAIAPGLLFERVVGSNAHVFGLGRDAYPALQRLPFSCTVVRTPDAAALVGLVTEIPSFSKQAVFALEPHYVRPSDSEWTAKPPKQ